jgi:NAD-dependent deacetylase
MAGAPRNERFVAGIVVLTGAGISAESGIKTFRDHNGLWENHRIEDVASPEGFRRDPELVQTFYNLRRRQLLSPEVKPNAAHEALAEFESRRRGDFLLVTQNIDNLHERAGSLRIVHMHGELLKARCRFSGRVVDCRADLDTKNPCPCCAKPGGLRPHVVWFGEMPLQMERIEAALSRCTLFISIGTSGQVYPAAGFVNWVPPAAHTVEINKDESMMSGAFKQHFRGPAGIEVPRFLRGI